MKDKQSPKVSCEVSSNSMCNELNGLPKLLNLRHISSSNGMLSLWVNFSTFLWYHIFILPGTPCNQQKPSDAEDWTPFSSVSTAVDESVFDRSCVSLMEDLSQSTISTPIRDLRQQMVNIISVLWRWRNNNVFCEYRLPKSEHGVLRYKIWRIFRNFLLGLQALLVLID